MDRLVERAVSDLRQAREELLTIPKQALSGAQINQWGQRWMPAFDRAESLCGLIIRGNIGHFMQGSWEETDSDLCDDLRARIVGLLDSVIQALDAREAVEPVLAEWIKRVADTKLATLLREFNDVKDTAPNLAAIGFRTILALLIRERAKQVAPDSEIAKQDDLVPERDIKAALDQPELFSSGERKYLRRYLSGGDKDVFDNVVHKPTTLIQRDELEDAVQLLNRLLPSISESVDAEKV